MQASIILVMYNGAHYLEACLDSIMQEIGTEDEIILVDNASSDGSARLVQEGWPGVRLIQNETNCGFAPACNQGAAQAQGETLVFLNQDTQVQPGWLHGLLVLLEQNPTIGLTTSKLLLMAQPEQIQMCGQELHFSGFTFGRGFLAPADGYQQSEIVGAVSGASFAIRSELWKQLDGFDPRLFMYYEETDLCWRARLVGYASWYAADSVVYHDYSLKSSSLAHYYSERNRLVLLLKTWKWPTLLMLSPSLLLAELMDWGYMGLVGWEGVRAKLRACGWLLMNFPAMLRARKGVQTSRKEADWVLLETCAWRMTPRLHTGGWIGRAVVPVCNAWFSFNYKLVLNLTRRLNL